MATVRGGNLEDEPELKARIIWVRTHMLVAVGAALFIIGPLQSGMPVEDMSRVIQGIVQGVGFLGADAILVKTAQKQRLEVTTTANMWATAGIGALAGLGLGATAVLATIVVLLILTVVPLIVLPGNHLGPEPRS
jgi:putative Mg2+ transporter-C (MgtC) family protein